MDVIVVCEPGGMKVDSKGIDTADLRRQEERAKQLSGPVVVRKLSPEERKRYGLPPEPSEDAK